MTLPGTAMLITVLSGVVVARRAIRERALTGPADEVRGRHDRREAALSDAVVVQEAGVRPARTARPARSLTPGSAAAPHV